MRRTLFVYLIMLGLVGAVKHTHDKDDRSKPNPTPRGTKAHKRDPSNADFSVNKAKTTSKNDSVTTGDVKPRDPKGPKAP
jgi:hypothetical protein